MDMLMDKEAEGNRDGAETDENRRYTHTRRYLGILSAKCETEVRRNLSPRLLAAGRLVP